MDSSQQQGGTTHGPTTMNPGGFQHSMVNPVMSSGMLPQVCINRQSFFIFFQPLEISIIRTVR